MRGKAIMRWTITALGVALLGVLLAQGGDEPAKDVSRIKLTVSETAGIRRFGYPVSVVLPVGKEAIEAGRFRLLEDGKPVTAQFSPRPAMGKQQAAVLLDFNVNHAPFEKKTYVVEYGPGVKAGPEARGGMKVEREKGAIRITGGGLEYVVPDDLTGLLRQVRGGKTAYLRDGSPGLSIVHGDGKRQRLGEARPSDKPTTAKVTRTGPLATALRFEGVELLGSKRPVAWVVEMEFPRSKSWARVDWTVDDPDGLVSGLGAELHLKMEGRTLVDFGAGSLVYVALEKGQEARMRAGTLAARNKANGPPWETLVGAPGALKPYVVATPDSRHPAEGWAHVLDKESCTAVAVDGFAAPGQQAEIAARDDGYLRIGRAFSKRPKRLTFWLHFVSVPVQVGAKTSPQAMLAPLRVEIGK
jgi:hypothetical protein